MPTSGTEQPRFDRPIEQMSARDIEDWQESLIAEGSNPKVIAYPRRPDGGAIRYDRESSIVIESMPDGKEYSLSVRDGLLTRTPLTITARTRARGSSAKESQYTTPTTWQKIETVLRFVALFVAQFGIFKMIESATNQSLIAATSSILVCSVVASFLSIEFKRSQRKRVDGDK